VRTMGPDELNAIEELTHKHWERASLSDCGGRFNGDGATSAPFAGHG